MDNFMKLCNDKYDRYVWLRMIHRVHRRYDMSLEEIMELVEDFLRMGMDCGIGSYVLKMIAEKYHKKE